jgi:N-acetylglucosaminyldiphosphoundecaprenol N-acetyl-beta-D-mannosaminyltransferase
MEKVSIFGVKISPLSFGDISIRVVEDLKGTAPVTISKAPSEFLLRAEKNPEFKVYLNQSDFVISDGIGVLWAAKYLSLPMTKVPVLRNIQAVWQMIYSGAALVFNHNYAKDVLPERLSGTEVFYTMLEACQEAGKSVYFFGARPEVLKKSVKNIQSKYPKLKIAGFRDGYSDKGQRVIDDINKTKPELLIVALGSPEQEFWVRDNLAKLPSVRVAVGEGGSLDYVAGVNVRAPKLIQKIGLEWLWRGLFAKNLTNTEGHRLKRVWNAVPVFIWHVVKYKLKVNK